MEIRDPEMLAVLVFVLSALLLIQSLMVVFVSVALFRLASRLRRTLVRSARDLQLRLHETRQQLARLAFLSQLSGLEANASALLENAEYNLRSVDRLVAKGLAAAEDGIKTAGRRIDLALSQFSRQTAKVHRALHSPAVRFAALLHGGLVAFREYFGGRTGAAAPQHFSSDEETFI